MGVQREGLLSNGGSFGVSTAWDNRWFSKVSRQANGWVVEMAIPFKTIRFKEGVTQWGINFSRNDLKRNENSAWSPVPRQFNIASLAFTGAMEWDASPNKAGANVSLIPYGISNADADYEEDGEITGGGNIGLDAKVAVTSSLNLDITVNPDFSQVEVDRQQTNLTRFSLFFPERRNFFIENEDLFSRFGFRQIRPFFSRRIGLANGQKVPIVAGLRLSGKVNRRWRIGLMNMQTASDTAIDVSAQNYSVATFQRQSAGRSYLGGIAVNREGFEDSETGERTHNRVMGLEYFIASKNNKVLGKVFSHFSTSSENNRLGNANASWLQYNSTNWFLMWNHEFVHRDYDAQVGFVPRNKRWDPVNEVTVPATYWRLEPKIGYRFYPKSKVVNTHNPSIYLDYYADDNLQTTDYNIRPEHKITFQNTSELVVAYEERFTRLFFDTDVTFSDGDAIPAGEYQYRNAVIGFQSNRRRKLNGKYRLTAGSYYTGTKVSHEASLTLRKQPWGIFTFDFIRHAIDMPDTLQDASINLVGPRVELSFTKSLFFTTFFQYNTQIDNFNINARFQWRFKPMSDLYVVYTDNYDANLNIKNRALVVKLVWWLTL